MADRALMDSEASVLATFDFLAGEHDVDDEDENLRWVLIPTFKDPLQNISNISQNCTCDDKAVH